MIATLIFRYDIFYTEANTEKKSYLCALRHTRVIICDIRNVSDHIHTVAISVYVIVFGISMSTSCIDRAIKITQSAYSIFVSFLI